MKDRSVEYPGRFKLTDATSGDEYIYDIERAEGNVAEAGTPFNVANVLTDATATALGLTDAATPNDAYSAIATRLDTADQNVADALGNEAAGFDSTAAYTTGDYVIYDGDLYKFTADHAAGDWTGSDATQVKVGTELTGIKEDFDELCTGLGVADKYSVNRFDKTEATLNKSINSQGVIYDATDTFVTDYMYVGDLTAVSWGYYTSNTWTTGNTYIVAYDESKTQIGLRSTTGASYSIPTGCKYVRIASPTSNIDINMLVSTNYTPTAYIPYSYTKEYFGNVKTYIESVLPKHITVGATGDYTSFSEAVTYAVNTPNSEVYVESGTYDIISEFEALYGTDFFTNYDNDSVRGLILNNGIKIIMSPDAIIQCHYTGNNSYVKTLFSPFNIGTTECDVNGFTIDGGEIDAKNVRYCVHDDPGSITFPYRNTYKNVHMKIDNTNNSDWGAKQCIGGGFGFYANIVVENCIFESVDATVGDASLSYHNCSRSGAKSNLVIKDNYIMGLGSIKVSWYGDSTLQSQAIVTNNSLGANIMYRAENASALIQNVTMQEWNNIVR